MGIQRLKIVASICRTLAIEIGSFHGAWAHACLSNVERDRSISVPA